MKLNIPANPNKITLGQFHDYCMAANGAAKVSAITGEPVEKLSKLTPAAIHELCGAFEQVVNLAQPILHSRFNVNIGGKVFGKVVKQFGFVPDLNQMSAAEFVDLMTLVEHPEQNMLKIAEVLFRPVKEVLVNWYRLEDYDSATLGKHEPFIRKIPLPLYLGARAFFLTTQDELLQRIPEFSQKLTKEAEASLKKEQKTAQSRQRRKRLTQRFLGTDGITT